MRHKQRQQQEVKKAAVNVIMPTIKLTIHDLAYLNAMLPGSAHCTGSDKTSSKLLFLGLIETVDIPPCAKALEEYDRRFNENLIKIKVAFDAALWQEVANIAYQLRNSRPTPKKGYGLTKSGIEFIEKGHAMSVTAKQGGCK